MDENSLKIELNPVENSETKLCHFSTLNFNDAEMSKKISNLEFDNERLRLELENTRIELSAKNAANQELKNKIAELFVEAQTSLQEKHNLQNYIKDLECRLTAADNSMKWYQKQVHEAQANKKTWQIEIDTYQNMLRQKSLTLLNVGAKCKQLNDDYVLLVEKKKKERDNLKTEVADEFKTESNDSIIKSQILSQSTVPMSDYKEISSRLEFTEIKLQESRNRESFLEERLRCLNEDIVLSKSVCSRQQNELLICDKNRLRCEKERNELTKVCHELKIKLKNFRSENKNLQLCFLSSKQERDQVEQAIVQLQTQLTKMIAQHKLSKSRNLELEEKLSAMQKVFDENDKILSLSNFTNELLKQEKQKTDQLKKQLSVQSDLIEKNKSNISLRDSLKQVLERNRELREQLKFKEECYDEGYADGSSVTSFSITNLPSPRPLSPTLLNTINEVLSKSKNFWSPIKAGLDNLQAKLDETTYNYADSTTCANDTPRLV